jgi:hypothetical protein
LGCVLGTYPIYVGATLTGIHRRSVAVLVPLIRRQSTVVECYPSSPAARAFQRLAAHADGWAAATGARGGIEFFMERLVQPRAAEAAGG